MTHRTEHITSYLECVARQAESTTGRETVEGYFLRNGHEFASQRLNRQESDFPKRLAWSATDAWL